MLISLISLGLSLALISELFGQIQGQPRAGLKDRLTIDAACLHAAGPVLGAELAAEVRVHEQPLLEEHGHTDQSGNRPIDGDHRERQVAADAPPGREDDQNEAINRNRRQREDREAQRRALRMNEV